MKAQTGDRGIPVHFLYFGTKRGEDANTRLRTLYPRERNTVPILKKSEMASGLVWRGEEYFALTTFRTLDRSSSADYSMPVASIQRNVD